MREIEPNEISGMCPQRREQYLMINYIMEQHALSKDAECEYCGDD